MVAMELRVLVCDDSMLIRKKMKDLLESLKCCVFEAQNGSEGFQMYKSSKPDAVFMDIVMPETDGLEALKQIKEYDTNAKVIMLSSAGTATKVLEALKGGAIDFIQKPFEVEQIRAALAKAAH
jgi:two-component system chemotaxis response regulator CheY